MTENTTRWAQHYEASTVLLLDAMATPSGEAFAYAHAEAERAEEDYGTEMERIMAHGLREQIRYVAIRFGYRLATRKLEVSK